MPDTWKVENGKGPCGRGSTTAYWADTLQRVRGRKPKGSDYLKADHRIQYGRIKQIGGLVMDRHG